jgi:hypothetical protein
MRWYVNQIGFDRRLRTWFYTRTGAVAGIAILMVAGARTGSPDQDQRRFSAVRPDGVY